MFVSRIISLLKTLKYQKQKVTLTDAVKKDFKWWSKFMSVFNGIELIIPNTVLCSVLGDACPMGSGAWSEHSQEYYSRKFPFDLCDPKFPIHLKEFWCAILAVRLWGHCWTGHRVAIYCDNEAVVKTIIHQKPTDPELQNCLREFLFHVCIFKFQPVLLRVSTSENDIADFLSRNHNQKDKQKMFESKGITGMTQVEVDDSLFDFVGTW